VYSIQLKSFNLLLNKTLTKLYFKYFNQLIAI
jgi:hypothetical protein